MLLAFGTNLLPAASLITSPVDCSVKEQITCENERHKIEKHILHFHHFTSPKPHVRSYFKIKREILQYTHLK